MSGRVANGQLADSRPPMVGERMERFVRLARGRPRLVAYAGAIALMAILFSFAGAYDTDEIALGHRLLLWTVIPGLIVGQTILVRKPLRDAPSAAQFALATPIVVALAALQIHALKFTPLVPHAPDPILGFVLFVAPAAAPIAMAVLAAEIAGDGVRDEPRDKPAPAPVIGGELNALVLADIHWLKSHDHYLEVGLADGQKRFVRGRISDAAQLLGNVDGAQVHRSWWVARRAVERAETRGRDRILRLRGGVDAPVGRTRVKRLRETGWF
ncbi:MAG: LytTR family DNA-binding domain-containing protein [Pseudomonadota bacterium]